MFVEALVWSNLKAAESGWSVLVEEIKNCAEKLSEIFELYFELLIRAHNQEQEIYGWR